MDQHYITCTKTISIQQVKEWKVVLECRNAMKPRDIGEECALVECLESNNILSTIAIANKYTNLNP